MCTYLPSHQNPYTWNRNYKVKSLRTHFLLTNKLYYYHKYKKITRRNTSQSIKKNPSNIVQLEFTLSTAFVAAFSIFDAPSAPYIGHSALEADSFEFQRFELVRVGDDENDHEDGHDPFKEGASQSVLECAVVLRPPLDALS